VRPPAPARGLVHFERESPVPGNYTDVVQRRVALVMQL